MCAKYILRLDDACPTANWDNWDKLEELLDEFNVKPIVAVIPQCKDKTLFYSYPREDFWERVKEWQNKGWIIGMHGYEHVYISMSRGTFSYVPLHTKTEFAGFPLEIQEEKIKKSWETFLANRIEPKIWIAPSHTFDKNTLKALKKYTTIRVISDTFAFYPFKEEDFYFIPQQLWKFRKFFFGVWTICLHPNTMSEKDFNYWRVILKKYNNLFPSLDKIQFLDRNWTIFEKFINNYLWFNLPKLKVYVSNKFKFAILKN